MLVKHLTEMNKKSHFYMGWQIFSGYIRSQPDKECVYRKLIIMSAILNETKNEKHTKKIVWHAHHAYLHTIHLGCITQSWHIELNAHVPSDSSRDLATQVTPTIHTTLMKYSLWKLVHPGWPSIPLGDQGSSVISFYDPWLS